MDFRQIPHLTCNTPVCYLRKGALICLFLWLFPFPTAVYGSPDGSACKDADGTTYREGDRLGSLVCRGGQWKRE